MVPPVGVSGPASIFSNVVFHDPFGPRIPTSSPRATSSETSSTTRGAFGR
jgi:hypothetical protein